jgi:hypothetical protein
VKGSLIAGPMGDRFPVGLRTILHKKAVLIVLDDV